MKKLLSILIASLLLLSAVAVLPVVADNESEETVTTPEWIITEICPDQRGKDDNTNGYTSDITADCFEFIEIYNNSDRELNLYDYAVVYNGSARDSDKFEHQITEYTPIKGGDYLDGSDLIPTEPTQPFGDLSNRPVNPDTCVVAPGEVVVLWMMYLEAYQARFNDGKGMSMDDFRAHWNIPEGVKVIAVDANGNTKNGGHSMNFNVKNSAVGTYGIAYRSEELEAACNVKDGGGINGNYWESEHLVCWVTVDFTDVLLDGSMDNVTYNFTWDFAGYAATDENYTYIYGEAYTYDARRGYMLTMYDEATAGSLNPIQKMTLGVELEEGESFYLDSLLMYFPGTEIRIKGYKINGQFYKDNTTFTAETAGLYTFDYFFEGDELTEAPTETETEEVTEVPEETLPETEEVTEEITEAPVETEEATVEETRPVVEETTAEAVTESVTDAATENVTDAATETVTEVATEAATAQETEAAAGGCGAVLTLAILPCLAAAAWIARKRED